MEALTNRPLCNPTIHMRVRAQLNDTPIRSQEGRLEWGSAVLHLTLGIRGTTNRSRTTVGRLGVHTVTSNNQTSDSDFNTEAPLLHRNLP